MNPLQESKQELNAAIRYAENAISSAKQTMESMNTYQEQTGREQALEAEVAELRDIIDRMSDDATGSSVTIKLLNEENANLKAEVNALEQPEQPTMPVIPKAVAIAIFREGVQHGWSPHAQSLTRPPTSASKRANTSVTFTSHSSVTSTSTTTSTRTGCVTSAVTSPKRESMMHSATCVQTRSMSAVSTEWTTKKKKRMTDEYMTMLQERICNMMQRYEKERNPNDAMILDCMLRDYEAKQRLMMQNEKLKEIQSPFPPGQG